MIKILNELNLDNSSNYKKSVLMKYKNNELLKRIFSMALDKVTFTYGVSNKTLDKISSQTSQTSLTDSTQIYTLEQSLDFLRDEFCTRKVTGNNAINRLSEILSSVSKDNADIIKKIIDRDLKVRLGRTEVNKIWKNLIVKPPYTRCIIGTNDNIKKNFPLDSNGNFIDCVYSEQKLDGTFRRAIKDGDNIEITSRPGIETKFPLIEEELRTLDIEGVFIGEMTLKGEQNRSVGNGIINSDDIPHEKVQFTVWDIIPLKEFKLTKAEIKIAEKENTLSLYINRFNQLKKVISESNLKHIKLVEYKIVKNPKEVYEHFNEIVKRGDEGTVIKSEKMTHKDGDSKLQQKVKLEIEIDVRITGLSIGNKGSKNEDYFAGIEYSNDEGTIVGSVGVTSLTEETRDWFNEHRDEVIHNVMSVICNDITKGRDNDYYALSHPRYKELRGEEKETDTLERALEQKQMAMEMKTRVR